MSALTDRVRELLRHSPAPLSERDAVSRLRPYGQGVKGAPANPPVNHQRPLGCEPTGALDGPAFDAGNLTA